MNNIDISQKVARQKRQRLIYRWHRRIGVSASLFILWIVSSGVLLNHSDALQFPHHPIHNEALAHWYGLKYTAPTQVFVSKNHWLTGNNDALILDGKTLDVNLSAITGFVETADLLAISNASIMVLLSPDGKVIDKLSGSTLPVAGITQIGIGCDGITIKNAESILASRDGLDWQACDKDIQWSTPQAISEQQLAIVATLVIPPVTVEKLLLDLHTGHFFGAYGPWVVDAIACSLLLLSLSGLWLFSRTLRKGK